MFDVNMLNKLNPFMMGQQAPQMGMQPFGHAAQSNGQGNPFLEQQKKDVDLKARGGQGGPWMSQPGLFGMDRQAGLMGGLGLLAGGRMF